jgi:molecular chaperone GrpE
MSDVESVPVDSTQPEEKEKAAPQAEVEQPQAAEAIPSKEGEPEEIEKEVNEGEAAARIEGEELEALRTGLEQARAQAVEYLDGWQRARAEFTNYKKRVEAEREELRRSSTEALLLKLLPVVDDFERAFQTLPEELTDVAWVDGMRMVLRKLQAILESQEVTPIEAAGQPFDPQWHEAVFQEETDEHPDGYVIEEMQRGYRLGERVLRPSMVKVASNQNESEG